MYLDCMLGFQSAWRGKNCNKLTSAAVMLYAITKAPTHQRTTMKLRTGKIRRQNSKMEDLVAAIAGVYSIVAAREYY